jgi:SET family sugar efflux transporter-like MFS transporter
VADSTRRALYTARITTVHRGVRNLLHDSVLLGVVGNMAFTSVAGAMITTSTSLFLANEVGASQLMIGLFVVGRGSCQILSGLFVGALSDRIGSRRRLLAVCGLLSAAGAFTFLELRDYYLLLAVGGFLFGLGSASFGQIFAYTRDLAEVRAANAGFLNSMLRALVSIAWIVGPPVGLYLMSAHGFGVLFCTAAVCYLVGSMLSLWLLPDLTLATREQHKQGRPRSAVPRSLWPLLSTILLLFTVSNIYQIDIALFITKDLGLPATFAGLLLGFSACLEVLIIMYLGVRAERWGKQRLLLYAAVFATVFFTGLPFAHGMTALVLLHVLNAVWTAIALTIPVTILQDAMPRRAGMASSLYSSSYQAGVVLGGAITGVVTQWAGFTNMFFVCALLTSVAAALLVREARRPAASDA